MRNLVLLAVFLFSPSAHALKISPLAGAGLEFGGDTLVDVTYSDGTKSNISAGRGLFLRGGAVADLLEATPHTLALETTLGLKWTTVKQARNGTVDWLRWPLELIAYYHNVENNFRLGSGVTYQFGNKLTGSKDAAPISRKFKNATGILFASDYFLGTEKNIGLGARYTMIKYSPVGASAKASGDSFGLWFTYVWL